MRNDEEHPCTYAPRTPCAHARNNNNKAMGSNNAYDYRCTGRRAVERPRVSRRDGGRVGCSFLQPSRRLALTRPSSDSNEEHRLPPPLPPSAMCKLGLWSFSFAFSTAYYSNKFKTPYSLSCDCSFPNGCICSQSVKHSWYLHFTLNCQEPLICTDISFLERLILAYASFKKWST